MSVKSTKQMENETKKVLSFHTFFLLSFSQIGSRLTFDAHDDINVINFYQTSPSLMFDDSEKLPVLVMNSGEPLRSDGFPGPIGGPFG